MPNPSLGDPPAAARAHVSLAWDPAWSVSEYYVAPWESTDPLPRRCLRYRFFMRRRMPRFSWCERSYSREFDVSSGALAGVVGWSPDSGDATRAADGSCGAADLDVGTCAAEDSDISKEAGGRREELSSNTCVVALRSSLTAPCEKEYPVLNIPSEDSSGSGWGACGRATGSGIGDGGGVAF